MTHLAQRPDRLVAQPVICKARIVGDWRINGTEPPHVWLIGGNPAAQ